jgi:hypothetical protein
MIPAPNKRGPGKGGGAVLWLAGRPPGPPCLTANVGLHYPSHEIQRSRSKRIARLRHRPWLSHRHVRRVVRVQASTVCFAPDAGCGSRRCRLGVAQRLFPAAFHLAHWAGFVRRQRCDPRSVVAYWRGQSSALDAASSRIPSRVVYLCVSAPASSPDTSPTFITTRRLLNSRRRR